MSSITTSTLPPTNLTTYSHILPPTSQPTIPTIFHDAMSIRNTVFVTEQNVPTENEFDFDDSRSVHIVAYDTLPFGEKIPIGTIRIVPFPHAPHPLPNVSYWDGVPEDVSPEIVAASSQKTFSDRTTSFYDGQEPYVKLGRMAVLKEYRGKRIGNLLAEKALEWLSDNSGAFDEAFPEAKEGEEKMKFKGLVCAHAQVQAQPAWTRWGFVVDEKMGTWNEEGIMHVGMFQRVPVKN